MAHLIDKDALVAEIESKKKYAQTLGDNAINSSMQQFYDGMKESCVDLLSFLNTLEVKQLDLEKEIQNVIYNHFFDLNGIAVAGTSTYATVDDMAHIAKHFFELGLKAPDGMYKFE